MRYKACHLYSSLEAAWLPNIDISQYYDHHEFAFLRSVSDCVSSKKIERKNRSEYDMEKSKDTEKNKRISVFAMDQSMTIHDQHLVMISSLSDLLRRVEPQDHETMNAVLSKMLIIMNKITWKSMSAATRRYVFMSAQVMLSNIDSFIDRQTQIPIDQCNGAAVSSTHSSWDPSTVPRDYALFGPT